MNINSIVQQKNNIVTMVNTQRAPVGYQGDKTLEYLVGGVKKQLLKANTRGGKTRGRI